MAAPAGNDSRSIFIYNLQYVYRKSLCDILDPNDKWEELGGRYMEYDVNTLEIIKTRSRWNQSSPTNQLLQLWGEQNHTVLELFVLLSEMHHYRAMDVLKPLVDSRYHRLCERGEEQLPHLLPRLPRNNAGPGPSVPPPVCNRNPPPCSQSKDDSKTGESYLDHNLDKKCKNSTIPEKVALPPVESKVENNSPSKVLDTVKPNKPKEDKERGLENNKEKALQDNKENRGPAAPPEAQRKLSNETIASSTVEICICYNELGAATNGWDRNFIIGRGGFGTVYKGTWKNTLVAIKKLESQDGASEEFIQAQQQQSLREIKFLNQFRHDNILPLYGYSFDGDTPCLVYQYMKNGSLEDRLQCRRNTPPLSWVQRCQIATGIARGLQFLHFRNSPVSSKPLIHGDIKSANILLDPCFVPKIGDFGLAREGPPEQYTHVTVSRVHGTRPYLPADFLRHKKFSTKVDTYSFGIVLFEIATGLRAYEENRPKRYLRDFVMSYDDNRLEELADPRAEINNATIARGLLFIGKDCVKESPRERPEMEGVLGRLDSLTEILEKFVREQEGMKRQSSPLSPTTPYTMQIYYDNQNNMSIQRQSSVPNSTAVVGSGAVRKISPQPIPQQLLQPYVTNNPHISVTPPSASTVGTLSQNNSTPSNKEEPSVNIPEIIPSSSVGHYDGQSVDGTSPADDLPLLSALGVKLR